MNNSKKKLYIGFILRIYKNTLHITSGKALLRLLLTLLLPLFFTTVTLKAQDEGTYKFSKNSVIVETSKANQGEGQPEFMESPSANNTGEEPEPDRTDIICANEVYVEATGVSQAGKWKLVEGSGEFSPDDRRETTISGIKDSYNLYKYEASNATFIYEVYYQEIFDYTLDGPSTYCEGETGVTLTLSGSQEGVDYTLYMDGNDIITKQGTGDPIEFYELYEGTYHVEGVATFDSDCPVMVTDEITVSEVSNPQIFDLSTPDNQYCEGSGAELILSGSQSGGNYIYQLTCSDSGPAGSPRTGTGDEIVWTDIQEGSYYVTAINTDGGCESIMNNTVYIEELAAPEPFNLSPSSAAYCADEEGVTLTLSSSEENTQYQLERYGVEEGPNVEGDGSQLTWPDKGNGTYTVTATGENGCTSGMGNSSTITRISLPQVFELTSSADYYCEGAPGVTLTLSESETGVSYRLIRNGSPVGSKAGTGSPITWSVTEGEYLVEAVTDDPEACSRLMTGNPEIEMIPSPPASAGADAEICEGETTGLNATGGVSYEWEPGEGLSETTIANPQASPLATTEYTVTVTDIYGCTASDEVTVTVNSLPDADAGTDKEICRGGQVQLNATGGSSYQWSPSSSLNDPEIHNPVATPSSTTEYTVAVTNDAGCMSTDNVTVTVNPLPSVNAGANASLCEGESAEITVSGTADQYSWSTGETGESITVTPTSKTSYSVTGTYTETGCQASDQMEVEVNPLPVEFAVTGGGEFCEGSGGVETGLSGSSEDVNYELFRDGSSVMSKNGTGEAISFGMHNAAGIYTVYATNMNTLCSAGMPGEAIVEEIRLPGPAQSITGNKTTCPETTVTYSTAEINRADHYEWTLPPGASLMEGGGTNEITVFFPSGAQSGTLSVKGVNECGEGTAASSEITVSPLPGPAGEITGESELCENTMNIVYNIEPVENASSYLWEVPAGAEIYSGQGTPEIIVDFPKGSSPGYITVTPLNSCGTGESHSLSVTVTPLPHLQLNPVDEDIDCSGSTVTLSAYSNDDVEWWWTAHEGGQIAGSQDESTTGAEKAGTYRVTATAEGCSSSGELTVVKDDAAPENVSITLPDPSIITCSNDELTLEASTTSTFPVSYQWTASAGGHIVSGQNTSSPVIGSGGNYQVTVKNLETSCTTVKSVTIEEDTENPHISVVTPAEEKISCINESVQLSGSSNTSGVMYEWTGPGNISDPHSQNPVVDAAGTYTLTVTAPNGCYSTANVQVQTDYEEPHVWVDTNPGTLNCQETTVKLNGSSSTEGATLLWTGPGVVSGETGETPTVNEPGDYTLTATHPVSGCTAEATVTVIEDIQSPSVDFPLAPSDITCSNPTVNIESETSAENAVYQWSTADGEISSGEELPTVTVEAGGTYTLTVTDADNHCSASESIEVGENLTEPGVTIEPPATVTCNDPSIELSGSSPTEPVNVQWETADGHIQSGSTTFTPAVTSGGTYNVAVTDPSNGCVSQASVSVEEDKSTPYITINSNPDPLNCRDTEVTLNGYAADASLLWTGPDEAVIKDETTSTPTVDTPGTYTLEATGDNGCTSAKDVEVEQETDVPEDVEILEFEQLSCGNSATSLKAVSSTTGTTYTWEASGGGNIVSDPENDEITVDAPGTYTVKAAHPDTWCTESVSITVEYLDDSPVITFPAEMPSTITCSNPEVTLQSSVEPEDAILQWEGPGTIEDANSTSPTVSVAGEYTLIATHPETGCITSKTTEVKSDLSAPDVEFNDPGTVTCSTPEITITATSSASQVTPYWSTNDGSVKGSTGNMSVTVTSEGTYTLSLIDEGNGCETVESIFVHEDKEAPEVYVDSSPPDITCSSGTVELYGTSPSTGATYHWEGPGNIQDETTQTPTVDLAGDYTLTVTGGSNGCSAEAIVTVGENKSDPQTPQIVTPGQLSCNTEWVELTVSPYIEGVDYLWTTTGEGTIINADTDAATVNEPGEYTVTVTDRENGCTSYSSVNVTMNDQVTDVEITDGPFELTCETESLTLTGSSSEGVDPEWTTEGGHILEGKNSFEALINAPGEYTLTVHHPESGCPSAATVTVSQTEDVPLIDIDTHPDKLTCGVSEVTLHGSPADPSHDFEWSTTNGNIVADEQTHSPIVDKAGTYVITVTDPATGCRNSASVTVEEDMEPSEFFISTPEKISCDNQEVQLKATSMVSDVNYLWTTDGEGTIREGDENEKDPVVLSPGTYSLTVTRNSNQCSSTKEVVVEEDTDPPHVSVDKSPDPLTCDRQEVVLSGSSLTEDALFEWSSEEGYPVSNPTSRHPRVSEPGVYLLTVTDPDNGCESHAEVTVVRDTEDPHIWITPDPEILTCNNTSVRLEGSSNTDNVSYYWTGPEGIENPGNRIIYVETPGRYYLRVTSNDTGCSSELHVDVEEDRKQPAAPSVEETYSCYGEDPETLTASGDNIRWYTNSNLEAEYLVHQGNNYTPTETETGSYYYYVTTTGSNGCESPYTQAEYTVRELPSPPAGSDEEICEGSANPQLHAHGTSVRWYNNPGEEELASGTYYTPDESVNEPGNYTYYITQTDSYGCESEPDEVNFTIRPEPSAPLITPASQQICRNEPAQAFAAEGENIKWYGSLSASTPLYSGNEYIPGETRPGSYSYYASQTSIYGCESEKSTAELNVNDVPQKYDVTGGGVFCEESGGVEVRLENSDTGVEYTLWLDKSTVKAGETGTGESVSFGPVSSSGSYTVTATGEEGCTSEMNGAVTVKMNELPGKPGSISGETQVCQGSEGVVYEIPEVEGATSYIWSIPEGAVISSGANTRTIYVDYSSSAQSGAISVKAVNSCGEGPVSDDLLAEVSLLPSDAGNIEATASNTNVCRGDTAVYEVGEIENATSYQWQLPSGASILQGEGSRTVKVIFAPDAATGDQAVRVRGLNECGEGAYSPPFTVTVDAPPSINAGPDQDICDEETALGGSQIPEGAAGHWETIQGYAIFSENDIHNPELTDIAMGENIFVYTINENACTVTDSVKVNNNRLLVDAGNDQVICSQEITLSGTPLPEGTTGLWSTGEGSASFESANSHETKAFNFGEGDNKLYWSITKNGCESKDSIIITNNRPASANAGPDISTCNSEARMEATAPEKGEGEWSIISGGGTFDNKNDPETRIYGLDKGQNKMAWTVNNFSCTLSDTVIVNNLEMDLSAGDDQTLCETRTDLEADPPPSGATGEWSVHRGSAMFMDKNAYDTRVSGISKGENIIVWSVTTEGCTFRDTLLLVNNMPTTAIGGPDQEITVSETQMEANEPLVGTGKWSVVSGGGDFDDEELSTAYVTDIIPGSNVFRWTITHEGCKSTSDVTIDNGSIESVYAGEDQTLCDNETQLDATEPPFGFGAWSVQQGSAQFEDNQSPDTRVYNLAPGENILRWSVSVGSTEYYDTLIIINNTPTESNPGADRAICSDSFTMAANESLRGTGRWTLEGGSAEIENEQLHNTPVENLEKGNNIFRWTITNENCISSDVVVISNDIPTEADAGPDQETCSGSAQLYPNTPTIGEAEWSVVSGSGLFENDSVHSLANGENRLRYTIRNNQCTLSDETVITNNKPTEADAGFNVSVCTDHVELSANEPNTNIGETGEWTVINGSGTFDDPASHNTIVTDLAPGKNVFRWTVYNEGCTSYDEIEVSYDYIGADAGRDIVTCESEVVLNANNPGNGKGQWSVVGGSGSARFEDPNSANTRVSGLEKGNNILRWTISNNSCVSYDEINIANNSPSDAYAGSDREICEDEINLSAQNPLIGTGEWSVINGSGNFENENSPNSHVQNIDPGANTYRWTVTNEGCTSTDEVVISNNDPVDTYAGEDMVLCQDSARLTANLPQMGEGVWSIVKGAGRIEDVYSNETNIKDLAPDENILRWTVTKGQCSDHSEVKLVNNKPTRASAGADRVICEDDIVLDGNVPLQGSGKWNVISGSGDFTDEELHNTEVENLSRGENILRWTITKENCTSSDDVIVRNDMPTVPDAGSDISVCDNTARLNANNPVYGTGEWSVLSGVGSFEDETMYNTTVSDIGQGTNVLRWEITHNNCSLSDDVEVTNNTTDVYAGPDQVVYEERAQLSGNTPRRGEGIWSLQAGEGEIDDTGSPDTWVTGLSEGANTFRWSVDIEGCISSDEVQISYYREPSASFTVSRDEGCPPFDVRFTKTSADSNPFTWEFGDGEVSEEENPVYTYEEPGSYTARLKVTGPDGREVTNARTITVHEPPEAIFDLTPTEIFIPDDELVCYNYSTNATDYLWDFGDGHTSEEFSPSHRYDREGKFQVSLKVWSDENCVDSLTYTDSISVTQKTRMRFPSAFRPNPHGPGDGRYDPSDLNNEVFYPIVLNGEIEDFKMEVYNRWGVLIFKTNDLEIGWDGYHKGDLAPEEVYIYRVSGVFNNGEKFNYTGDFLLLHK